MRLRVATYNVLNDATFVERLPAVGRALGDLGADVLLLQEVPPGGGLAGLATEAGLPVAGAVTFRRPDDGWTETLAVLARDEAADVQPLDLRPGVPNCLRVTLATPVGHVAVYSLHLHPRESAIRRHEIAGVLARLGADPGVPAIVGGDFNATPGGKTLREAFRSLRSGYDAVHGAHPGATFPTPLRPDLAGRPGTALDHILFRAGEFRAVGAGLFGEPQDGAGWPSDHWGVVVDFER